MPELIKCAVCNRSKKGHLYYKSEFRVQRPMVCKSCVKKRDAAKIRDRKDRELEKKYGIPPGTYERMLRDQWGRCAICRRQPRRRDLAVDHNHKNGRVRGLLCTRCNEMLGHLRDSPAAVYRALRYLEEDGLQWRFNNADT